MGKKESKVEKHLVGKIEELGGICYKFTSPGRNGVPDRVCVMPKGLVVFVETKAPNGRLSPRQRDELSLLNSLDQIAHVANTFKKVNALVEEMRRMLYG